MGFNTFKCPLRGGLLIVFEGGGAGECLAYTAVLEGREGDLAAEAREEEERIHRWRFVLLNREM